MFEIAICDDDKEFLNAFEARLTAAIQETDMSGRIVCYTDCGALLEDVRGGRKYDLLFLDILFGTEEGNGPAGSRREPGGNAAGTRREMDMSAAGTRREIDMSAAGTRREMDMSAAGTRRETGMNGAEPWRETGMNGAETQREMGMSTAKVLREMGVGADIIFMSTTPDFAVDSFDVSPLHYLLKPIEEEKLKMALARFLDRNRPGSLSFSSPRGILRILLADILYFEIYGHEILIHQAGGNCDTCTGTLKELETALPARIFVRPHRSYLVNLDHVAAISRYRIRLDDGEFIPISKNLYRQTQESFIEYAEGSCLSL